MYTNYIRGGLAVAILAFAIYLFFVGWPGSGVLLILLAILVGLTIVFNEALVIAFLFVRKGNMEKAKKVLGWVKTPEGLLNMTEAYYYYLMGMLEMQTNSLGKAEKFFKKALKTGLVVSTDQAVSKLNLAGIAASKRKKREALNLLAQAKKLDTNKMLGEQIKMVEFQLGRI
ncbi:MAG: hypothetical protein WD048_03385 [Chitinophagales bacterium]